MMVLLAAAAPRDLTFETTVAAVSSALLIAFAALRWSSRARRGRPDSRTGIATAHVEFLAVVAALTLTCLVIVVCLYAMVDGTPLSHNDRLITMRIVIVSLAVFVVGTVIERLAEPAERQPGTWDFIYPAWADATGALVVGLFVTALAAIETGTSDTFASELRGMLLSILVGAFASLLSLAWMQRVNRQRRREFLQRANRDEFIPARLEREHPENLSFTVWLTDSGPMPKIALTRTDATRMIRAHERQRVHNSRSRDLALRWSVLHARLRLVDESEGVERWASDPTDLGLVVMPYSAYTYRLGFKVVPDPSRDR